MTIPPAVVEMTDLAGTFSKYGRDERGIRGRADNFVVRINVLVEIVIDVG